MASAMEKALIKQGMPDKTARKEAKARIEAMKIAKIRKQGKKRLKKKILESMVWEDRENRIFERRETEPRVQQKGWHRERILRGTWDFENVNPANSTPGNGMSSEHHLSKYQPKMNIPPQSIEGTVDNEGEGGTLKEGTVLSTASKSLNSFMPLYAEAMRIHRVTRVSTGFGHTICCTDQGACLTFGRGKDGQLGHSKSQDQFTPAVIESLREVFVIDVGAGLSHSCVISRPSDRLIFCFGMNKNGQCGTGSNIPTRINKPVLVKGSRNIYPVCVSVGNMHTAVLGEDGTTWTWGDNSYGQLGHGKVPNATSIVNQSNSSSKNEPKQVLSMRFALVSHVALGSYHTALVTENGDLFMCGRGDSGQLGLGNYLDQPSPVCVTSLERHDVIDVACGAEHTVVCTEAGMVFGMGSNHFSQLGLGDGEVDGNAGNKSSASKRQRGSSPRNNFSNHVKHNTPQHICLGDLKPNKNVQVWRVAAGTKYSMFISRNGNIFGCGESGYNGRMGHMTNKRQDKPSHVQYLKFRMIKENRQWMQDFIDTFKGMVVEDPKLDPNCTAVYELMKKDKLFKIAGNRVSAEFMPEFHEYSYDNFLESRKIELRRCFNMEDIAMKGRANALTLDKILHMAHVHISDSSLDKMAVATSGVATGQVNLEDFLEYAGENWESSITAEGSLHKMWVSLRCDKRLPLLNEDDGVLFLEVFEKCLQEEGLTENKDLFYHMRDDGRNDPKFKDGRRKQGKGGKNRKWSFGVLDLKRCSLTDLHLKALCKALALFPCVREIDLRFNFLSSQSTNVLIQLVKDQYQNVCDYNYHFARCNKCHEDVEFRKRDSMTATCLICGAKVYRCTYLLSKCIIKEKEDTPESLLKWLVVDCDEDLSHRLIERLKTHETLSVPKFKRFCLDVRNEHIYKFEEKMDQDFEHQTRKMKESSTVKKKLLVLHNYRKERLFKAFRKFIDDKTKHHYLKLYRTQASYELQVLLKRSVIQMGEDFERAFEPLFPTTTERLLELSQSFHHECKERIRQSKWHVPNCMQMIYEIVFKGARDLYCHYAGLNLDNIPASIDAGDRYTTIAMRSGRVMTFGNQDDIISGFRDEIMQNLPKKYRRMIEKQRNIKIKKQLRKAALEKLTTFQAKEGFTLPKQDSVLHGLNFIEDSGKEGNQEEPRPESTQRHSPTRARIASLANPDIPAFTESSACHFYGRGNRTSKSTHARDVAHDAGDLLMSHRRLSMVKHDPDEDDGHEEEHEAYSSESSVSSYSSDEDGADSEKNIDDAVSVSSYGTRSSVSGSSYTSASYTSVSTAAKRPIQRSNQED